MHAPFTGQILLPRSLISIACFKAFAVVNSRLNRPANDTGGRLGRQWHMRSGRWQGLLAMTDIGCVARFNAPDSIVSIHRKMVRRKSVTHRTDSITFRTLPGPRGQNRETHESCESLL
jgi:hypothetical protein